jgi:hypothetical protein
MQEGRKKTKKKIENANPMDEEREKRERDNQINYYCGACSKKRVLVARGREL